MRKLKRKLTPFLAHEMLYDYATGQLDADRNQAVEEFLEHDPEGRSILAGIRAGLEYAKSLSNLSIGAELSSQLRESENAISLGKKYSSWNEWPEAVRWSITAVVISTLVATVVSVLPWNKLHFLREQKASNTVEVAQIPAPTTEALQDLHDKGEAQVAENDESSGDEAGDDAGDVGGSSGDDEAAASEQVASAPKPTPAPQKLAAPPIAVAVSLGSPAAKPVAKPAAEPEQAAASDKKEPKAKGFVYRAFMTLDNLDDVGPQIADVIRELGGEKAGEVELGWKRGTGRYYHFAMPELNEKKLMDKLQAYGPVRISKDPHPRVMPEGQIRFILWVESQN